MKQILQSVEEIKLFIPVTIFFRRVYFCGRFTEFFAGICCRRKSPKLLFCENNFRQFASHLQKHQKLLMLNQNTWAKQKNKLCTCGRRLRLLHCAILETEIIGVALQPTLRSLIKGEGLNKQGKVE